MLIDLRCPKCGKIIQFDDSQATMFCPYCGCKVARPAQPNVQSQPVQVAGYTTYQNPQAQVNVAPINTSQPVRKSKSPLSIVAFILSLTILLTWLGVVLGMIDAFLTDRKKYKNHILSYWAMGIGAFLVVVIAFNNIGGSKNPNRSTTKDKVTADYTDPTFKDGTLNLEAIESMKTVSSGEKYIIYDSDFNDSIVEARWWDYDSTMDDPGIYNKDTETLAFSIKVNENAEDDIYYAYYYSRNKEFDKDDLSKPIYKSTIHLEEYGDGSAYYNIDCSKKTQKGYYLVIVASDSSLNKPYLIAYAEVK